jgi:glycosyltransferase involved in cell wall biosynthesis
MKIGNIMLGGSRGGVEQAAVDYAIALRNSGHEVITIVRRNAAIIHVLERENIPYICIAKPQSWNPLARWRIAHALQGCKVAFLHGNRAGEMVARYRGRKNIAVAHSRFFEPQAHFDAVIALSKPRAAEIKTQFSGPVHTIPNMLSLPAEITRAAWRSPPVIGSMGRLSHEKGFDLFLDALAILRAKNIPFHARIGGEGKQFDALRAQAATLGIADAITWLGWVADKAEFFSNADIYCMPSRTENFPISLLEAMAHGCPAVATACGGGPAAMLADGHGILTPITAEGIAHGLAQALGAPAESAAMGIRGRTRVAERYAMPVVAKQLNALIADTAPPVLNVMLGRARGGLEQAALDYAEAMACAGIRALTVIAPKAWVEAPLVAAGMTHESLPHHGAWDLWAAYRLRRLAQRTGAVAILCHGNRALSLALLARSGRIPIIAVAHNYKTRRFVQADACFAITQHLTDHLASLGIRTITRMPNMVRIPEHTAREPFRTPPVIGSMGRLVAKKGFLLLIEALALLRTRGVAFRAVLGGEGPEAGAIEALIAHHQLGDSIRRIGWVADKAAFFHSLDVFVLPSHHEPFGIVLIEAMSRGVPVISTDSEGPSEILHHGVDGLIVGKGNAEALADAIQALLADPARAAALGEAGAARVAHEYSMEAMAKRLQTALAPYI